MSVEMIRLDDRLIHGQIVAAWVKNLQIDRIWIVDDGVSNDEFIKGVMRMVSPPDTELIITGEEAIETNLEAYDDSTKKTLILIKYPYVAQKLFAKGVKKQELNVGGMGANANRKKLFKNISASEEEKAQLKQMKEAGIKVYFQVTPNERETLVNL